MAKKQSQKKNSYMSEEKEVKIVLKTTDLFSVAQNQYVQKFLKWQEDSECIRSQLVGGPIS